MDDLSRYLQFLFEGLEGYVYAPVKTATTFKQKFFTWPDQGEQLRDWITTSDRDSASHVYISPAIYSRPQANKSAIKELQVCWIEFDGQERVDFRDLQVPSAIVQSSSSTHLHCYWRIPPTSSEVVEDVNRRLTYYLDADTSGWDTTQLLRPPTTVNRKHDLPVLLASLDSSEHALNSFDPAPTIKSKPLEVISEGQLPAANQVMSSRNLPTKLIQMIKMENPPVGARSSFLAKLGFELAEEGLNYAEIVSLLLQTDRRIGKFDGRTDQLLRLTQLAELALFRVLAEESLAVYTYDDILHKTKDLEWILNPWLHKCGLLMVSSAPNVGKTQLMLQMITCLSLGIPFLGLPLDFSTKHSIFFMSLEMPPEGLKYILERQNKQLQSSPGNNWAIITESTSLTHYENLIDSQKATVVLVDSLTELLDDIDSENENVRARIVLKWIRKVRRRYGCAVILIHHNRKATEGNKKPKSLHDLAGSFQFGKDSDTVIQLWEDSKGIEVSSVKCRYGPKESFYTTRNPNTLWFGRSDGMDVGQQRSSHSAESTSKSHGELDASNRSEPTKSDSFGTVDLDFGISGYGN